MNKAEIFWDKLAHKYDKTEKRFEQINKKLIERTKKFLNKSDVVLDFGCATGSKPIEIARFVKIIQGIDISTKMVDIANKNKIDSEIKNLYFSKSTIFDI